MSLPVIQDHSHLQNSVHATFCQSVLLSHSPRSWQQHLESCLKKTFSPCWASGSFSLMSPVRWFYCATNVSRIHVHTRTNHPTAASVQIASVNHGENKVITSLSLQATLSLLSNSCVLQCDGKKWGSLRSELQLFLIEVSDFPRPHTCVKQMIMLLESFTVTLLRWIWAALSHHANVAVHKNLSHLSYLSVENYFCGITKKDYP